MGTYNLLTGHCPACTREVPRLAARCPYCTTILNAPQQQEALPTIGCEFCGYQIPAAAKICVHCNAQKVTMVDDSSGGRMISAIKYGCSGFIPGILLAGFVFPNHLVLSVVMTVIIAALIGYFAGDKSEEWKR